MTLYSRILDEVEDLDHDVFATRAAVSTGGKLRVAGPALVRAWWARTPRSQRPGPQWTGALRPGDPHVTVTRCASPGSVDPAHCGCTPP